MIPLFSRFTAICRTQRLCYAFGTWDSAASSKIRFSKLLSQYATNLTLSRNAAESLIKQGEVTFAGRVVTSPQLLVDVAELRDSGSVVVKVQGKGIQFDLSHRDGEGQSERPVVYAVHKLAGEVVAENDPQNRPSMVARLMQGGVGVRRVGQTTKQMHLKPIGRLDIPTEGLCLVTNDGEFARQMELPANQVHRVYRARVHGRLTPSKLERIRNGGVRYNNVRYGPMKISIEKARSARGRNSAHPTPTNTWVQITSTEGKNRQIRNVFEALGVTVTRLIRIHFGDYSLQTIPPGMAIEVPYKPVLKQKARGPIGPIQTKNEENGSKIVNMKWVSSAQ